MQRVGLFRIKIHVIPKNTQLVLFFQYKERINIYSKNNDRIILSFILIKWI